ncbi:MAG: hypothetical protein K0S44_825 [Bacteroidetes bacterium]|jgi:hypothetical protein|nr:hypothetical protein [Bacteroidota bacterium]
MKTRYIDSFVLICLIWAGMVIGISFLEAPVKFTAPSLTLQVGLDVGRHVFGAFNKVEIVFSVLCFVILIAGKLPLKLIIAGGAAVCMLLLETFWLLPVLDERALKIIAGETPEGTSPHMWYIVFDLVKLVSLIAAGYMGMRLGRGIRERS